MSSSNSTRSHRQVSEVRLANVAGLAASTPTAHARPASCRAINRRPHPYHAGQDAPSTPPARASASPPARAATCPSVPSRGAGNRDNPTDFIPGKEVQESCRVVPLSRGEHAWPGAVRDESAGGFNRHATCFVRRADESPHLLRGHRRVANHLLRILATRRAPDTFVGGGTVPKTGR